MVFRNRDSRGRAKSFWTPWGSYSASQNNVVKGFVILATFIWLLPGQVGFKLNKLDKNKHGGWSSEQQRRPDPGWRHAAAATAVQVREGWDRYINIGTSCLHSCINCSVINYQSYLFSHFILSRSSSHSFSCISQFSKSTRLRTKFFMYLTLCHCVFWRT